MNCWHPHWQTALEFSSHGLAPKLYDFVPKVSLEGFRCNAQFGDRHTTKHPPEFFTHTLRSRVNSLKKTPKTLQKLPKNSLKELQFYPQ